MGGIFCEVKNMDVVTQFDMNILHAIHEKLSCGFMDFVMPKVTMFAEYGIFWILVAVVMLVIRKYRRCGVALCVTMLSSLLVGNVLLKHVVARARPCWLEPDYLSMLVAVPKDFSFPSGHSMISFTAAVVIFRYNKKLGIPALCLAALIAFSRLYLFVHFPTDVLAGSVIGVLLGIVSFVVTDRAADKIRKKRELKKTAD